jgi:translation initiation factor IF-1
LNRLALTKTESGTLAGTKLLQGERNPSGGQFNALLADKAAFAPLKMSLDLGEHNEAVSAKPVTLAAGLGRQLTQMETFESTAFSFQSQDASGADLEKESEFSALEIETLQPGDEFRSSGENPNVNLARPNFNASLTEKSGLLTDQPSRPFDTVEHSAAEECRPPLDLFSLPVVAAYLKQIVHTGARSSVNHVRSEIAPNDNLGRLESEEGRARAGGIYRLKKSEDEEPDYQPASRHTETTDKHAADASAGLSMSPASPVPVGPQMIQLRDFETEAPASNPESSVLGDDVFPVSFEREVHPALLSASENYEHIPRISRTKSTARHASVSDQTDARRSAAQSIPTFPRLYIEPATGWAAGASGLGRAVMGAKFLPPGRQGLQAISRSDLITALPQLVDANERTADFTQIIRAVRSEPEPKLAYESDTPVLSLDRRESRRSEVSDKSVSSAETAGRMSLAKMADEAASDVVEMQAEKLTPLQAEANAAPQPISNSGTILASIRQLASELAEPQVFLSDAEEVRAEINGRMKSVRINLRPESLGGVTVHLHNQQDKLRIDIRVQNDDAGRALLPEIDSIAGALSGLGLALDQVTLTAPGGGITVVHSSSDRGGGTASQSQGDAFQERPAGENGSRHPERRKTELDEKTVNQSRGIYI